MGNETQTAINTLAQIPIGTIIAWLGIFAGIITGICTATVKLYKLFTKYKEKSDEDEDLKEKIKEHADTLGCIKKSIDEIKTVLDEQYEINFMQRRHSIVVVCEQALNDGKISAGLLQSTLDLYEEYRDLMHGNGYVKILIDKVVKLPVIGSLE